MIIKVKTWEELCEIGNLDHEDIKPPKEGTSSFVDSMEELLPEDRIIDTDDNEWYWEPWMYECTCEECKKKDIIIKAHEDNLEELSNVIKQMAG